jgi:histidinol-phosphate/aromatic aminotransferase/cobyric acid decarboxylase-like protein
MTAFDHRTHGGRRRELAARAGVPEEALLDFSANLHPLGPPPWLSDAIAEATSLVAFYPDPDSDELRLAAADRFGGSPDEYTFADGADSLLMALPRALNAASTIVASPCYSGYARAASSHGARLVRVPLEGAEAFSSASPRFASALRDAISAAKRPALVMLGWPNNPAGGCPEPEAILRLARAFPETTFALDDSFAELTLAPAGALPHAGGNIVAVRSLTKAYAIPGARVGFARCAPETAAAVRAELSAWPVSCFAARLGLRALKDPGWPARAAALVGEEAPSLQASLRKLGIGSTWGGANFLLLDFGSGAALDAADARLARSGMAIRRFAPDEGLPPGFARIAIRLPGENARLLAALAEGESR